MEWWSGVRKEGRKGGGSVRSCDDTSVVGVEGKGGREVNVSGSGK